MTKVKCDITGCRHNSSCCSSPSDDVETICTLENISLMVDEEFLCENFEENYNKEIECTKCMLKKYGAIKLNSHINEITFSEHDI